ncbi:MAG: putative diguanylate cyclase [Paucimonas sp.]|nr:putative diguanylate cyclase [Paucimonas sp.]
MGVILYTLAVRDQKTRIRLLRTFWAATDYLLFVTLIFGFALIGSTSMEHAWRFLWVALALNTVFVLAIASGLTLKLADPALTLIQICTACTWILSTNAVQPALGHLGIVVMFVPLSYACLLFEPRVYIRIMVYVSLLVVPLFVIVGAAEVRFAVHTLPEQALSALTVIISVGRFLTANAAVSRLRADLKSRNDELIDVSEKLANLASRDELTGLRNRREFMRILQQEADRSARGQPGVCVSILDIDYFKQVNDVHGHPVGDAVLHQVAVLLDSARRATDTVARYGGEEFTLLLPGTNLSTAELALERVRSHVAQHDWSGVAPGLKVTVSAGIADWKPDSTLASLLSRADAALYEAKKEGRNCVRVDGGGGARPAGPETENPAFA